MKSNKTDNAVIIKAWEDYRPEIASINEEKIAKLSFNQNEKNILSEQEIEALQGKTLNQCIFFLLGLNSINYQYWDKNREGEFTRYTNNSKVGALAAFEGYYSLYKNKIEWQSTKMDPWSITLEDMDKYFGDIPDKARRAEILNESSNQGVVTKAAVAIINAISTRGVVDVSLAQEVADIMPKSFADPYLKKIQLALYEICMAARARNFPHLKCELTVAADYQVPKVLEALGAIEYCPELSTKIEQGVLIEPDSLEEKAIRSATILACNEISHLHSISIPALDRHLWMARNNYPGKKFHLTKTPRY